MLCTVDSIHFDKQLREFANKLFKCDDGIPKICLSSDTTGPISRPFPKVFNKIENGDHIQNKME